MRTDISLNGRARSVSIEPRDGAGAHGGSFRVVVDGAVFEIEARVTALGLCVMFADGRVLDAAVTEGVGGEWVVQLPQASLTALVNGRRHRRGKAGGTSTDGEQRVVAPMPGRVLRVLVQVGDEVAERQGLAVVEAMKMENEIGSPKAGRVKEVAVSEGASIEAGRLLVVVE